MRQEQVDGLPYLSGVDPWVFQSFDSRLVIMVAMTSIYEPATCIQSKMCTEIVGLDAFNLETSLVETI